MDICATLRPDICNDGRVNITVLRHFVELSETLHFGRASARANISTSALSRHIRQLEAELNPSQLFLGGSSDTCTPGYYNQEGTAKRYRDVRLESYSKGLGAYRKVLNAWRLQGELEGLVLG